MARITIIGAGMAGLLAANMLRRRDISIIERQSALPNNHHAVLRFRSDAVSKQLHIPFRKVQVFKGCDEADPIKAAIHYAKKVTGRYEARSLIDLSTQTRFIAPLDLVEQMASGFNPAFDCEFSLDMLRYGPAISTMPMEALMDLLEYKGERPEFRSLSGWTVTVPILDCDMFVTKYLTRPTCSPYRISITGNQLIVEGAGEAPPLAIADTIAHKAMMELGIDAQDIGGIPELHKSRYAKIAKLSSADRRKAQQFMFWATTEHNIYSLGRFATWRAGLLLDDLVNDVLMIERWITFGPTPYEIQQLQAK